MIPSLADILTNEYNRIDIRRDTACNHHTSSSIYMTTIGVCHDGGIATLTSIIQNLVRKGDTVCIPLWVVTV